MSLQSRIILGALAGVALMAGFWFMLLAPKRSDAAAVKTKIVAAEGRRDTAVSLAATAEQARKRYHSDYATVARLGKAVPADDDVASLIYQIETVARRHKIDFRAVKLNGAAANAAPAAPAPAPAEGKDKGKDKGKDGTDPTASSATPVAPVVAQSPPGTVVGPAGLITLPLTLTFDGGYLAMQRFLKALDGLADTNKKRISVRGRLLTVDGFSLTASRLGFPKLKAEVGATAYIVPATDGGATPQGPASTATSPTSPALTTATAPGDGR